MPTANKIFDFTSHLPGDAWAVQDDVVMGGRSSGRFEITREGHGRFSGHVSLENNGGFSSVLHTLTSPITIKDQSAFVLRVKGDGKAYTWRVKTNPDNRYYHEGEFDTSGEWETVRIPFAKMNAVHHGEPVDVPNYAGEPITKFQLLIGNGTAEDFEILLDWVAVE